MEKLTATHLTRFHTDPSGTFMRYDAKAIGSGSEAAQSELQDKWHSVRSILNQSRAKIHSKTFGAEHQSVGSASPDPTNFETSDGGEVRPA